MLLPSGADIGETLVATVPIVLRGEIRCCALIEIMLVTMAST